MVLIIVDRRRMRMVGEIIRLLLYLVRVTSCVLFREKFVTYARILLHVTFHSKFVEMFSFVCGCLKLL